MSDNLEKQERDITPMSMISIAIQNKADTEQLSKLLELQERWERNEARKAFVKAMTQFKENLPDIVKNKQVKYGNTKFDYATLDNIADVIGEGLSKYNLSFRWNTENNDKRIKVTCILTHELGHSEKTSLEAEADTSGNKNAIQGLGSAVTYLQRYTLLAITGMAAKNTDTDGNMPVEKVSEEQAKEITNLLQSTNSNIQAFFKMFDIQDVKNMTVDKYKIAIQWLNSKKQAGQNATTK